ncbi:ATP phosphoribosyltransferase regulatory subunit [Marasmitruncus massiliensis]|uniref:ATP phosphoribosyltransferase regulatory subunit n=1 Tax=Marasmitruncus massiliensis TaxID=1944642 RepID=UPI000C7C9975|nr:ATP phosphoribosyltransferase regulatory subunit [Marasmitruncus massiliensis]
MKRYNKSTPDGTRDLLFEECEARDEAVFRLTAMFRSRGYRQVMTPAIEFYDVFGSSGTYFPQENMYKLTDNRGRLMVMRPDCTIPIARLAATRLTAMPMPLRLYYSQNVYRMGHDERGKRDEIFQTGVELIGSNSLRSDLEIVELAASGLSDLNGESFRLEICHIGYFRALIDSLDTDDATKEEIRQSVEQKNYAALNDLLEQFGSSKAAAALKYLPRLFGGEEVFEKAYSLFDENGAKESLDYLKSIYEDLCQLELEDRVLIDLGLVNQAEYYTGIIFRGYLDGIGEPVLSGGRYDNLIHDFGVSLSATGFAVTVDLVTGAVGHPAQKVPDILVFADENHLPQAINYIKSLAQNGLTVENCVLDDFEAAADYARRRGIAQLHVVDDEIELIDVDTL